LRLGGFFWVHIENNNWYVIESIDPGYGKTVREVAYFKYDIDYVNHLANIRCRLYNKELILLGLWHRHPGSMDVFSGADEDTNKKFVNNCQNGSISALINVDPSFRITMYHISPRLHYQKIKNIECGNKYIPSEFLTYKKPDVFLNKINKRNNATPSKFQEKLLEIFEYEFSSYLSKQKNYEYEIQMGERVIEINMKRIDDNLNYPLSIFIELFITTNNKIGIRFNKDDKEKFEYEMDFIRTYITGMESISIEQKSGVTKNIPYGTMVNKIM